MQNFEGQTGCIMGDEQMANSVTFNSSYLIGDVCLLETDAPLINRQKRMNETKGFH